MPELLKPLASAFIATALLGSGMAAPALAGGYEDKDDHKHSWNKDKHDDEKWCEDAEEKFDHREFHKHYGWDAEHAGWWHEKHDDGDNECDDDDDDKKHYYKHNGHGHGHKKHEHKHNGHGHKKHEHKYNGHGHGHKVGHYYSHNK